MICTFQLIHAVKKNKPSIFSDFFDIYMCTEIGAHKHKHKRKLKLEII